MEFKIQVLNGFKLYSDQLIGVFKHRYDGEDKINLDELTGVTGLNRRKTRLILNYLADIGLSEKQTLKKSALGSIIYRYDEFLQREGTIWLMHYLQSTNPYLVIWNRTMNMLFDHRSVTRDEILSTFGDLEEHCSQYSFNHHIGKEIRIILDAYTNQLFDKLNLLEPLDEDDRYLINRNQEIPSEILFASILHYKEKNYPGATSVSINELCDSPNSPGRVFLLDTNVLRKELELLKRLGFITIESRADLDQIRLKDDCNFLGAVEAYYKTSGGI